MKYIPGFTFTPGNKKLLTVKGGSLLQNKMSLTQNNLGVFKKNVTYTLTRIAPSGSSLVYYFRASNGENVIESYNNSQEADNKLEGLK